MIRRCCEVDGPATGVLVPSEKVAPDVPNELVGRRGVLSTESRPLDPLSGRIVLGVAENVPALHPPVLKSNLFGLPTADSVFILAVRVSMTRKSSPVICCPFFASRNAARAAEEADSDAALEIDGADRWSLGGLNEGIGERAGSRGGEYGRFIVFVKLRAGREGEAL